VGIALDLHLAQGQLSLQPVLKRLSLPHPYPDYEAYNGPADEKGLRRNT
jgi:hypothetical protein